LRIVNPQVAHLMPTDNCPVDPDLAEVIARWPDLPASIRSAVLLMVRSIAGK
jgi:hypothetical protein